MCAVWVCAGAYRVQKKVYRSPGGGAIIQAAVSHWPKTTGPVLPVLRTELRTLNEQHAFLTAECHSNQGWLSNKRLFCVLMAPLSPKVSTGMMLGMVV